MSRRYLTTTNRWLAILGVVATAFGAGLAALASGSGPAVPQSRMGDPIYGLDTQQQIRFDLGKVAFERNLTVEEGLGPVFNQTSCASCHNNPVGGNGNQTVTRFGHIGKKGGFDPLSSLGGSLLQANSNSEECSEIIPPEANITSLRVTLGALGFGFIEAISDQSILDVRDAQDPAVQGFARMVELLETPGQHRVGRFGWKGQVATVLSFSADAALNEMGLTNRLVGLENAPNGDFARLAECDTVADPEDVPDEGGVEFIDRVTDFQRFLAVPPQTPRYGMSGESIFMLIGCGQCHTPAYVTADDPVLEPIIRAQQIRPYSDFLLHDMGLASDGIADGPATGRMIRTPVLWGVRNRNPLWHDGRFADGTFDQRLRDSIAEHGVFGSQGQGAAGEFALLTTGEQNALIQFLGSLGQAEFDATADDRVDLDDFNGVDEAPHGFRHCWNLAVTPDDPCAVHDLDQDGYIGFTDRDAFLLVYDDLLEDCNFNGVVDLVEILDGAVQDEDLNGIPDECDCPGEVTEDGIVDITDLLAVIAAWGNCSPPCAADTNFDGIVDIVDLLQVLTDWGICSSGL